MLRRGDRATPEPVEILLDGSVSTPSRGDAESKHAKAAARRSQPREQPWSIIAVVIVCLVVTFSWMANRSGSAPSTDRFALPQNPHLRYERVFAGTDRVGMAGTAARAYALVPTPTDESGDVTDTPGHIYALDAEGNERWTLTIAAFDRGTAMAVGDAVVITTFRTETAGGGGASTATTTDVTEVDPADATPRRHVDVYRVDDVTGQVVWHVTRPASFAWPAGDDSLLLWEIPPTSSPSRFSPILLRTLDTTTGYTTEPHRFDRVGLTPEPETLLVERDGEAVLIDASFAPTSTPVPLDGANAAAAGDEILVVGADTTAVYDRTGTLVRSAPTPSGLGPGDDVVFEGLGDGVWLRGHVPHDGPIGTAAFSVGDGVIEPLDQYDDYTTLLDAFGRPVDGYVLAPEGGELTEITSGTVVASGESYWVGASNGAIGIVGHRVVGIELPSGRELFSLGEGDSWDLLEDGIATSTTDRPASRAVGSTTIRVYG